MNKLVICNYADVGEKKKNVKAHTNLEEGIVREG